MQSAKIAAYGGSEQFNGQQFIASDGAALKSHYGRSLARLGMAKRSFLRTKLACEKTGVRL
jgi:hypothetical protein